MNSLCITFLLLQKRFLKLCRLHVPPSYYFWIWKINISSNCPNFLFCTYLYFLFSLTVGNLSKIFPTTLSLDQDLGRVGILLDSDKEGSDSAELTHYYSSFKRIQGYAFQAPVFPEINFFCFLADSGDVTPVSCGSELELNTDTFVTLRPDCDITVTDDTILSVTSESTEPSLYENNSFFQGAVTPKAVTPLMENINVCKNIFQMSNSLKHVDNTDRKVFVNRIFNELEEKKEGNLSRKSSIYEKETPNANKNLSSAGSSKWTTEKERFLDTTKNLELVKAHFLETNIDIIKNLNIKPDKSKIESSKPKPGTVFVKEKYIEPPKVTRISRSFHGKSNTGSSLDITSAPRRASDGVSMENLKSEKDTTKRKLLSQLSQPCGSFSRKTSELSRPRFTTRIVDEAEHAASVGLAEGQKKTEAGINQVNFTIDSEAEDASFQTDQTQ